MPNAELQSWMVSRGEHYDYQLGRDPLDPLGGRGITATSAPRPEPFTWGKVLRVHVVGEDYAIVEYVPHRPINPPHPVPGVEFGLFVRAASRRGWDTNHSFESLDTALIAAIAWKAESRRGGRNAAANSQAVRYISRLLELDR